MPRYIIIIPQKDASNKIEMLDAPNKIEMLDGTKKKLDERIKLSGILYHTTPIWSQTGANSKGRKRK